MSFASELQSNKNFIGNIIIRFGGEYFSIRDPDSGLILKPEYRGLVNSLVLPPTNIDPRRVSTTVVSASFQLVDKNNVITDLMRDTGGAVIGQKAEIWIGRVGVAMDFSDYHKIPDTFIKTLSHPDNTYTFSALGNIDRINRTVYQAATRLLGDINSAVVDIVVKDDITDFPASGFLVIDNEFVSYASKDDTTKRFSGLSRGLFATTAVDHSDDAPIELANVITDNPVNIILRLLLSGGGGSSYDNLADGCGIDQSLVDITAIESIRDDFFSGVQYTAALFGSRIGTSALTYIENEFLFPNKLRLAYSDSSKLTLAVLDSPIFPDTVIDNNTVTKFPQWAVDGNKIVNNIQISWDFDEDTQIFNQIQTFTDAVSIAAYGLSKLLSFEWHGVKAALDGATLVDDFQTQFFSRMASTNPEISVDTQVDKGLSNIGDKVNFQSTQVPSADGTLKFNSDLEIISQSINWLTGDVKFKLAFTSFTGIRSCFLAPSDTIASITSQKIVGLNAGRGAYWTVGWNIRLWNNLTMAYETDAVNSIADISGDTVTFTNNWVTVLTTHHRLKFPDFDDATSSQKQYCFISPQGLDFSLSEKSYKITP